MIAQYGWRCTAPYKSKALCYVSFCGVHFYKSASSWTENY